MAEKRAYICADCGEIEMAGYMVHDSVWKAAGAGPKDLLHLSCLEKRLNRPINAGDFKPLPCNREILWALAYHDHEDEIPTLKTQEENDQALREVVQKVVCCHIGESITDDLLKEIKKKTVRTLRAEGFHVSMGMEMKWDYQNLSFVVSEHNWAVRVPVPYTEGG